eukprot:COSAG02_NODE_10940_length_1828_cov_1.215732_2_plen_296_part_00
MLIGTAVVMRQGYWLGVVIRQRPHCAMASVHRSVDGGYLFHRSARPRVDCKESTQFKQVSRRITGSMSDHSIPARGCYRFDLEELRHRESTPADQSDWIRRARMTKSEIFIPTSTVNASALDAAQTLLEFAKEARWVDPTTAEVEVSFLVMSLEYAMLSEVALRCHFHLGGYVETDFSMHSTVASVFEPVRLALPCLALPCLAFSSVSFHLLSSLLQPEFSNGEAAAAVPCRVLSWIAWALTMCQTCSSDCFCSCAIGSRSAGWCAQRSTTRRIRSTVHLSRTPHCSHSAFDSSG